MPKKIEEMTIAELQTLAACAQSDAKKGGRWVFQLVDRNNIVGDVVGRSDGHSEWILSDAAVVRIWGTSKGLGELAGGPTSKTKLDPLPDGVRISVTSVIFRFPVTA